MGKKVSEDYHGDFKYETPKDYGEEPQYKSGRPTEKKPARRRGGRKGRDEPSRKEKPKMGKKEMQDEAFQLLFKLEKLMDKAAKRKLYFPEIEEEVEYLEADIKKAKSPVQLQAVMDEINKMGKEISQSMRR